jgi:hypothetical protein
MFPSTHLPSFIQISLAISEKQVRDARTHARVHGRTRVKIISCHSFAWQLDDDGENKKDNDYDKDDNDDDDKDNDKENKDGADDDDYDDKKTQRWLWW